MPCDLQSKNTRCTSPLFRTQPKLPVENSNSDEGSSAINIGSELIYGGCHGINAGLLTETWSTMKAASHPRPAQGTDIGYAAQSL